MSVAELNRQVVFGQAQEFPKHFGWPFFDVPDHRRHYMVVALFPVACCSLRAGHLAPARDPTRFAALSALCLATIAIRRPGPGHSTTIGALVLVALVLVVCDLAPRRTAVTASWSVDGTGPLPGLRRGAGSGHLWEQRGRWWPSGSDSALTASRGLSS